MTRDNFCQGTAGNFIGQQGMVGEGRGWRKIAENISKTAEDGGRRWGIKEDNGGQWGRRGRRGRRGTVGDGTM